MNIRRVEESDLNALVALGINMDEAAKCSATGETYPTEDTIRHHMIGDQAIMAEIDNVPKGLVLFRGDGTIHWLVVPTNYVGSEFRDATVGLIEAVYDQCGSCQGRVGNSVMRDRIVSFGYTLGEGNWISYA